ncbi:DUF4129 domain-containing protein [Pseudoxanthomonas daejeonensis]|uniref:DUF4129 domain-containing protein n=1 Tax=Pseudoxanthomonas daejeonensis TaxID=266062 RepID=A0ABQ6Z757_9GAMM|nr:DUF4129 domain-containing protein [Pseudoxanthomonas daejeonensis]KAF1694460.1 DUF4129 domain-containing protein [Pseudoxanthomonas daejeonensis]
MRPEDLDVALRPRSSWEAMELGTALLRRHAGAVWRPWLLATLPVLVVLNAAAWMLDRVWLAALLMWWLKPLFDRIPLYVLSRGVFGHTPGTVETLRAQWSFGRGAMPAHLLWRRLSPARSLLMPVDLLEGSAAAQRRARRRVVGGPAYGQAALLTWTCWHFELALALGVVAAVFLAVPPELLPDSLNSFWMLLRAGPPPWLELAFNGVAWLAVSVVGPFYVAAGFGLYLNRRTETEAWDVELAFRRLRERLLAQAAAPLALLLACMLLSPAEVLAQQQGEDDARPATLEQVFGQDHADDARFRDAVARTYRDPLLGGERTVVEWRLKSPPRERTGDAPDLSVLAALLSRIGEWMLWIAVAVLVLLVLVTAPRWLPWLGGSARRKRAEAPAAAATLLAMPEASPEDIAAAARRLWQSGHPRDALALVYRGSVEAMARDAQVELPPGATEAQCLRASRKLPLPAARELFAQVVRVWQYAAYAGRLPAESEFDSLLDAARTQWAWRG